MRLGYKSAFVPCLVFLYFLCLNMLSPPQGDDWNYILSNQDSISHSINMFIYWNSRLGEFVYGSILSHIPVHLFDFINAIVAVIFMHLFFYILFLRLPNSLLDFGIIALSLLLFMLLLSFEEVFLWGAGSLNYLWGFSLGLFFLIPYRKMLGGPSSSGGGSKGFCICMLVCGFVIGVWHEGTASLILASLLLFLVVRLYRRGRIPLWFYMGIVGLFVGFCVLFFSPGQNSRILAEASKYDYMSIKDFLSLGLFGMLSRLNTIFTKALNQAPIFFPIFAFVVAFIYAFWHQIKARILALGVLLLSTILFVSILLGFPLLAYLMIFAMFIYIYIKSKDSKFLVCAFLLFFYFLSILSTFQLLNLPFRSRALGMIFLVVIIVILLRDYLANKKILYASFAVSIAYFAYVGFCYYDLNSKWNNLVHLINSAKEGYKGEKELITGKLSDIYGVEYLGYGIDIVVPKEQYSFTYMGFTPWWHLSNDTSDYINQSYAYTFKIRSIALSD